MKQSYPILQINNQKALLPLDRRYSERVPIRYQIRYFGIEGARVVPGQGSLNNLSKTGCKILGSTTNSLGSRLTLVLHLEDGQAPLCFTEATISWIGRDSFAVKFPRLSAEERRRLQGVICKNVSAASLDDRRTAFRIV
jgi:hypothetical protein